MGFCSDDSTNYLKGLGYNVVRLPREDIKPLQLLGVQNNQTLQLGGLDQLVLPATSPLPAITPDAKASAVNGQRSSELAAGFGLNVLAAIIGGLGGDASVKAEYKAANSITFEFADVTGDSIVPLDVGGYLRHARVDSGNKIVEQYVLGNGRLYLVTRTLKSKKFRVEARDFRGVSVGLDVPVLQQVVGVNVKVSIEATHTSMVTYEGSTPLVFGFQCLDVGVRDGRLSLENTAEGAVALAAGKEPPSVILDNEGLLELQGPAGR